MAFFDFLTDAFTGAPAKRAGRQTRDYLTGVQDQGLGDIRSGYQGAQDGYHRAQGELSSLGNKYGGATDLYLDASGANGSGGYDRARSAFQEGPGYQYNLNQGLDAINRRRAAGGMLASGNADRDAQTFGAGLASNEYNGWLGRLQNFIQPEYGARTGLANSYSAEGNALSAEGNALAGLRTGLAGKYTDTYGQEAAAQQQGSKNIWDLGVNLAALGTGQFGKAAGMGGGGSGSGSPGGFSTSPLFRMFAGT